MTSHQQTIYYSFNHQTRIDRFLHKTLKIPTILVQKLIRNKQIKVNNLNIKPDYRLKINDAIIIKAKITAKQDNNQTKLTQTQINNFWQNIIYEDQNLIAINKPSGLATQGGSGIKISVDDFVKAKKYQLVHRLDKDTSGLLLIAKNLATSNKIYLEFKQKSIIKTYLAIVLGEVKKTEGIIDLPLSKQKFGKNDKVAFDLNFGKTAITKFYHQQTSKNCSLLKLQPITGRTHQLRVHCKEIGHPIVNDIKYGGMKTKQPEISKNLCLHAWQITIKKYHQDNSDLIITAPIPQNFRNIFNLK